MNAPMEKMAVLISGTGRTLRNILDKIEAHSLHAQVVLVIASSSKASGTIFAEKANIPFKVMTHKSYPSDEAYSEAIFSECRSAGVGLVVLGGWLKRLVVPHDYEHRVVNIHPSLIPSFCGHGFFGHHVHEAALKYGVKLSGCTIHFVDNEYDHGAVILQSAVPVMFDDTPDSLAARVFQAECDAYPQALEALISGRVCVKGRSVKVIEPSNSHTLGNS